MCSCVLKAEQITFVPTLSFPLIFLPCIPRRHFVTDSLGNKTDDRGEKFSRELQLLLLGCQMRPRTPWDYGVPWEPVREGLGSQGPFHHPSQEQGGWGPMGSHSPNTGQCPGGGPKPHWWSSRPVRAGLWGAGEQLSCGMAWAETLSCQLTFNKLQALDIDFNCRRPLNTSIFCISGLFC